MKTSIWFTQIDGRLHIGYIDSDDAKDVLLSFDSIKSQFTKFRKYFAKSLKWKDILDAYSLQ